MDVTWRVEIRTILSPLEIAAFRRDMQARFLRLPSASAKRAWKAWANRT